MKPTGSLIEQLIRVKPETGEIFKITESGQTPLGSRTSNGYVKICLGKKFRPRAHHVVWMWAHGYWPKAEIDHINGNRDDNRIANLREATVTQNRTNRRIQSNNKCGHKWVSSHQGKFRAEIRKNGRRIYSSSHDTPEEAHAAACLAAKSIHGDFFNSGGN